MSKKFNGGLWKLFCYIYEWRVDSWQMHFVWEVRYEYYGFWNVKIWILGNTSLRNANLLSWKYTTRTIFEVLLDVTDSHWNSSYSPFC